MAAKPVDPLLPRPPGGMGGGALLALAVHGALVLALAAGVRWRHQPTETFSAELWAALPQAAAPRAVEPEPTPEPSPPAPVAPPPAPTPAPPVRNDAQIAIEKAEREKARADRIERERAAEAKRQREADAALLRKQRELQQKRQEELQRKAELARQEKARKAQEAQLERQRQDNLKRMLGQAGATGAPSSSGTALRSAGPSATYGGLLIGHIKPNIVLTDHLPPALEAVVEVRAAANGTVLSRRIVRSSGNTTWDDAVLRAIDRSGALPRDKDGRVPASIEISFRSE